MPCARYVPYITANVMRFHTRSSELSQPRVRYQTSVGATPMGQARERTQETCLNGLVGGDLPTSPNSPLALSSLPSMLPAARRLTSVLFSRSFSRATGGSAKRTGRKMTQQQDESVQTNGAAEAATNNQQQEEQARRRAATGSATIAEGACRRGTLAEAQSLQPVPACHCVRST